MCYSPETLDFLCRMEGIGRALGLTLKTLGSESARAFAVPREGDILLRNLARVLTLLGALCIVALGLLVSTLGIVATLLDPGDDLLAMAALSASFLALTVGLGLALAWQAWQAIQGRPSRPFQPRHVWVLGLLFLLAVLVGQVVLVLDFLPALTFPPFHVLAATLPPLIVVALVGRALGGVTRRRDMVLQLSSGAFLSTSLASSLEFVCVMGLLITLLAIVALQPGGMEQIQDLVSQMQDPSWLQDPAELVSLTRSPVVLASAFLLFAVAVPLIEEAVKTVGVGLMAYRRPTMSQAFLWGLAGGAGFALAEGLFNTIAGMDAWAPIAVARIGATLLHCFTGALMGLAWYAVLARRQWRRAMGLYAVSVGVHGLWNALSGGMVLISLGMLDGNAAEPDKALAGLATAMILTLLIALALAVGLGLVGLTWVVRKRSSATETPEEHLSLTPAEIVPNPETPGENA
jgi:hypothetical protein